MTDTTLAQTRAAAETFELRDTEEADGRLRRLAGRAVPYGIETDIGEYVESIEFGCFAKSIKEAARGLPLLLFHNDTTYPIGVSESWEERRDGLHGIWRLSLADEAQYAARLVADGMITGMSVRMLPNRKRDRHVIGFKRGADEKDLIVRTEARLVETSLVTTPAYVGAEVTWIRSTPRQLPPTRRAVQDYRDWLESVR